jgi:hypothetical protein
MKNIYFWACDICKSSGEGILARSFIKKLKIYNKNYKIINICKKSKFQKKNLEQNCSNFFHKYIFPLYGIYVLWKYHLNGKITCYINYLPLWNILIFLLLPQKTILGPITGSYPLKKWSIKLNFIYKISSVILKIKYNKLLFSTNFFAKEVLPDPGNPNINIFIIRCARTRARYFQVSLLGKDLIPF